jgi:hypothetical protein
MASESTNTHIKKAPGFGGFFIGCAAVISWHVVGSHRWLLRTLEY